MLIILVYFRRANYPIWVQTRRDKDYLVDDYGSEPLFEDSFKIKAFLITTHICMASNARRNTFKLNRYISRKATNYAKATAKI